MALKTTAAIRRKAARRVSDRLIAWVLNATAHFSQLPPSDLPSIGAQGVAPPAAIVHVPGLDVAVPTWALVRPRRRQRRTSRRSARTRGTDAASTGEGVSPGLRTDAPSAAQHCPFCSGTPDSSSTRSLKNATIPAARHYQPSPLERILGLPGMHASKERVSGVGAAADAAVTRLAADVLAAMGPLMEFADDAVANGGGYRQPPKPQYSSPVPPTALKPPSPPAQSLSNSRSTPPPVPDNAPSAPAASGVPVQNTSAVVPPPRPFVHPIFRNGAGVGATGVSFCGLLDAANATAMLLRTAHELARTCSAMYSRTPTGLAPEIVTFYDGADFAPNEDAQHSLLRPESVESFFVLHRLSGSRRGSVYQRWAWQVFQAIEAGARVAGGGYTSVGNVSDVNHRAQRSSSSGGGRHMESFFLAETLKYLYLAFEEEGGGAEEGGSEPRAQAAGATSSEDGPEAWRRLLPHDEENDDDRGAAAQGRGRDRGPRTRLSLPLDAWVFNTEAHPFRKWPALAQ
jgi:hypothetical protein